MPIRRKVQLIAYPDRIGQQIADLADFIEQDLGSAISGLHLLPPYPSNADGGFSPLTHKEIDPRLGSWADLERISARYDLCLDLILNHISDQSPEFQDFLQHGPQSRHAGLFVNVDALGEISADDLAKIHIRKEKEPFRTVHFADGSQARVWCTFTERQIDLNYNRPEVWDYMADSMQVLRSHGVNMLRLDAFGYTTKQIGTRCFLVEPQVWQIMDWFRDTADGLDIELLPEVHDHPSYQFAIERQGMWAYGFALPPLVIHALLESSSVHLKNWLRMCPRHQVTVLDTHDGICMPDVDGLLPAEELQALIQHVSQHSAGPILRRSAANPYSIGAIYQLACTFFDALGRSEDALVVARAIQLFAPGIPQVYYVGLLGGGNDEALLQYSGELRDINRHYYELDEARLALQQPVARRQLELMRLRCSHPAFDGAFELHSSGDSSLCMGWRNGEHECQLFVDLNFRTATVTCTGIDTSGEQSWRA